MGKTNNKQVKTLKHITCQKAMHVLAGKGQRQCWGWSGRTLAVSGHAAETGRRRAELCVRAGVCREESVPSGESNECKDLRLEDALSVGGITKGRVCNNAKSGHGRAEFGRPAAFRFYSK